MGSTRDDSQVSPLFEPFLLIEEVGPPLFPCSG